MRSFAARRLIGGSYATNLVTSHFSTMRWCTDIREGTATQVLDRIKEFLGFAPGEDDPDYAEETEEEVETPPTRRQTAQIIPISPLTRRSGPLRVVVVEPRDFEEVQTIVDQM